MILGTASHAGKSLITAAFCRIFARRGYRVAPFKAQNMSLNSAATVDGYEIGRAQALQAEAAGVFATREMNPILMKPYSDQGCQIVANGIVWGNLSAQDYHLHRVEELFPLVLESYAKLASENDLIVLEGAGSPAEINLKEHDIVNMRMAAAADAACLLVGDIDRGGVFAALYGTLALLEPEERRLIRGLLINKFRGDVELLHPGLRQIEELTGKPCIGTIPFIHDLQLDEEDSVSLDTLRTYTNTADWQPGTDASRPLRIAVIALPYLSNFTDFDSLIAEPSVSLRFVNEPAALERADLVIIPGSKQTIQDFHWMERRGLAEALRHRAPGTLLMGICGGMQMMGLSIADPHGMEGGGEIRGLEILPIRTTLAREKTTAQVDAKLLTRSLFGTETGGHVDAQKATGYEIHLGETMYEPGAKPLFEIRRRHSATHAVCDGAVAADGLSMGSYLHGLFDDDGFRHGFLTCARTARRLALVKTFIFRAQQRQAELDRLANTVEASVDMNAICKWMGLAPFHERPHTLMAKEVATHE